jgi:hypothetical protein
MTSWYIIIMIMGLDVHIFVYPKVSKIYSSTFKVRKCFEMSIFFGELAKFSLTC